MDLVGVVALIHGLVTRKQVDVNLVTVANSTTSFKR